MNKHENGTIVCGSPGSVARELSEFKDEVKGVLVRVMEQLKWHDDEKGLIHIKEFMRKHKI